MAEQASAGSSETDAGSPAAAAQRMPLLAIVADVVRHALPLVPMYFFDASIANYVLLTAFDLSLGLIFIVGSTRDRGDPTSVDPRSRWLVSRVAAVLVASLFMAFMAAIIALPLTVPAFIFGLSEGVDWHAVMTRPRFWLPVGAMALLAGIRYQIIFESWTVPGERGQPTHKAPVRGNLEQDRKRSLADYAAQVTLIATFAALCFVLLTFGRWGLYALPILYAALLVFYDVRPDVAQRIFPQLWRRQ